MSDHRTPELRVRRPGRPGGRSAPADAVGGTSPSSTEPVADPSQSGEDVPAEGVLRQIQDLDDVASRAQRVWAEPVAREWLQSPNAMLNGATPLTVLKMEGPAPVIAALDAACAGSYA